MILRSLNYKGRAFFYVEVSGGNGKVLCILPFKGLNTAAWLCWAIFPYPCSFPNKYTFFGRFYLSNNTVFQRKFDQICNKDS
uniref:Uncharacterized protein n=1 Tax=Romanomermis culicivorax TaxID=13658 RepID=A0A915IRN5_ROMCU